MNAALRNIRRLMLVALMVSVAFAGFRAPLACAGGAAAASASVATGVEHSAPLKCKCGGRGKCCKMGCCATEPAKTSDQKSQANTLERRDPGVAQAAVLIVTDFGPTAFPRPTSSQVSNFYWLGTLIAQHTCLQV